MGIRNFIKRQPVRLTALVIVAPVLLNLTIVRSSQGQLAFLSNSEKGQLPAPDISPLLPPPVVTNPYDGRWLFTGAGCRGAGSVMAVIKNGKVIVRGGGGNVTPDGIIHTVGAGNGMTLTAEGRLSGDSGSGTYDRSDGCSGTWVSVRQRR